MVRECHRLEKYDASSCCLMGLDMHEESYADWKGDADGGADSISSPSQRAISPPPEASQFETADAFRAEQAVVP